MNRNNIHILVYQVNVVDLGWVNVHRACISMQLHGGLDLEICTPSPAPQEWIPQSILLCEKVNHHSSVINRGRITSLLWQKHSQNYWGRLRITLSFWQLIQLPEEKLPHLQNDNRYIRFQEPIARRNAALAFVWPYMASGESLPRSH